MADEKDPRMTNIEKAHAALKAKRESPDYQPAAIKKPERLSVYAASRKLAKLNFDPLEKLVKLYQKIQGEVIWMESLKNATVVNKDGSMHKYSKMAHHNLLAQQQKLLNDLMRFGYARVPETVNVEHNELPVPVINLTPRVAAPNISVSPKLTNIVDGEVVQKVT